MANTFTLIQTIDLSAGGQTSLDFQNITNTYKDLALYYFIRNTGANGGLYVKLNNNSSSYYNQRLVGSYTSITPSADAPFTSALFGVNAPSSAPAGYFSNGFLYISDYANTSRDKSGWFDSTYEPNASNLGGNGLSQCIGWNWNNTSAINRITITSEDVGSNLAQYSYASLYGIS
jgi:hypothetical protein